MGYLPIPVDMYFNDFAMEVLEYNVLNNNNVIGTYQGLSNSDEDGPYIGFKMSDQPQISTGNILRTVDGLEEYQIIKISYDRYEGKLFPHQFRRFQQIMNFKLRTCLRRPDPGIETLCKNCYDCQLGVVCFVKCPEYIFKPCCLC